MTKNSIKFSHIKSYNQQIATALVFTKQTNKQKKPTYSYTKANSLKFAFVYKYLETQNNHMIWEPNNKQDIHKIT